MTPASSSCPNYKLFGIRGSGEKESGWGGYGLTVNTIRDEILKLAPGGEADHIDYPAIGVEWYSPNYYLADYWVSETEGELKLQKAVETFAARCKTTPIVVVGYSQDAHAAGDMFQSVASTISSRIILVMLGDPRFNSADLPVDQGSFDPLLDGSWAAWANFATPKQYKNLRTFKAREDSHVRSYCTQYGPVCNASLINLRRCAADRSGFGGRRSWRPSTPTTRGARTPRLSIPPARRTS